LNILRSQYSNVSSRSTFSDFITWFGSIYVAAIVLCRSLPCLLGFNIFINIEQFGTSVLFL